MPSARLKFRDNEITVDREVTTVGRSSDNDVAFPEDSNVSRYHAEIEDRGGDLWLIDLGSSNGTTVNGERVAGEKRLSAGDRVVFGGTSELSVESPEEEVTPEAAAAAAPVMPAGEMVPAAPEIAASAPEAAAGGGWNPLLLIAGVVCGLAVISVLGATAFLMTRGSSACEATAVIISPETGDTIIEPAEIEVAAEHSGCVTKAVFTINGREFASAADEPYTATLDPEQFPELANGFDHSLAVVLVDENGAQIPASQPVLIGLETRETEAAEPEPEIAAKDGGDRPKPADKKAAVSLIDVQEMSVRLMKQFPGSPQHNVNNKQFLTEVQKRAAEYAQPGYFQRAAGFRDVINVSYTKEQNLDAALGFLLAMSRSRFMGDKRGAEEGLWKMTNEFVSANGYNGLCGGQSLSDPSQNCAAQASAIYMKAMVFGVFGGDVIYSAAAFGRSPQDAGEWKASLPAGGSDLWQTITTPQEREQLVRFFAAGIVAENPGKFGLAKDRPLSELYRVTL